MNQVRALIAVVGRVPPDFNPDADVFRELGIASAAALDLLLRIEEEFEISIDDEQFARTRTLTAMSALVSNLRGNA
jgi:acyl carrier protein